MLEAAKGEIYLLEAVEGEICLPEVMRCSLRCMLEDVEGGRALGSVSGVSKFASSRYSPPPIRHFDEPSKTFYER